MSALGKVGLIAAWAQVKIRLSQNSKLCYIVVSLQVQFLPRTVAIKKTKCSLCN